MKTAIVLRWQAAVFGLVSLCCVPSVCARDAEDSVSLAGAWQFQLDPDDIGIAQRWFSRTRPERIQLPGALRCRSVALSWKASSTWSTVRRANSQKGRRPVWINAGEVSAAASLLSLPP